MNDCINLQMCNFAFHSRGFVHRWVTGSVDSMEINIDKLLNGACVRLRVHADRRDLGLTLSRRVV